MGDMGLMGIEIAKKVAFDNLPNQYKMWHLPVWRSRERRPILCDCHGRNQVERNFTMQCMQLVSWLINWDCFVWPWSCSAAAVRARAPSWRRTTASSWDRSRCRPGSTLFEWLFNFQVYGSEEQKMDILPSFVTGDKVIVLVGQKRAPDFKAKVWQKLQVGCFMLSEPGNGSDAGAASTK